jgi:hypothetical protein
VVWNVVVENRGVWKVFIPGGLDIKVFKRNGLGSFGAMEQRRVSVERIDI